MDILRAIILGRALLYISETMPHPLPERVVTALRAQFSVADQAAATALLAELHSVLRKWKISDERCLAAALKLGRGDLEELGDAVQLGMIDWRDLLVAAKLAVDPDAHDAWLDDHAAVDRGSGRSDPSG